VLSSHEVALELVCVDDGSTDRSDDRVRVLRSPPLGIVAALDRGLREARGDFVARMDADDEMHPDRLAAQVAMLDDGPDLALVGCQVESFRDGGLAEGYRIYTDWVNGLVTPEAIEREAFVECPVPHPTWTFRRSVVLEAGGYCERGWPEDLDLLYRLLERGHRIGKVARVLHRWRDHPDRLSRRDPRYGREAFLRAKAHYVGRVHPMRAAVLWGAGRTGRRLARLLEPAGVSVRAFLDIRRDRAGTAWRGIPILSPDALSGRASGWVQEGVRVLGAVASRGARGEIRSALRGAGLLEGDGFLMLA
jgi:glycosyltransferase involved in cell wall biosynthesis